MKIFHINMHHAWGGQPNRVLTKSIELQKRGHEVWVSGPRDCELVKRARKAGLHTFDDLELLRGLHPLSFRRDVQALKRLFNEQCFDIVHTHGSQDTWVSVIAARAAKPRIPVIRTRHNTFEISGNPVNRWLYGKAIAHVITVSPQVNVYLTNKKLMRPDQITPIYSAPDLDRFKPSSERAEVRAEFGFSEQDIVVISVARLAPEKGHIHLVDAAAIVREDYPSVRYLFAGQGRSRSDIEARIAGHGLQDVVKLAGFRTDVPRLLGASDIFVLSPTAGESLGTAILEGFLMELPAVATDVGGVCESVRDGKTGFLVPPANAPALAQALKKLVSAPELRRQFGKAGRAMVLEEFTPRQLAEKTERVYLKVLGK